MIINYISNGLNDTLLFAKKLAKGEWTPLNFPMVFILKGEVGAGKTTFVRSFASQFNLDQEVTSPTFTILNEYSNQSIRIAHFDLYRLSDIQELAEIGLEDHITNNNFIFIEWPDISLPLLNFNIYRLTFTMGEHENQRIIVLEF